MGLSLALTVAGRDMDVKKLLQEGASENVVAKARDELTELSTYVPDHVERVLAEVSNLKMVMRRSLGLDSLDQEVAAMNAQLNAALKKP
jgi:phosphoglycerate dehydrogenase-like enzyme